MGAEYAVYIYMPTPSPVIDSRWHSSFPPPSCSTIKGSTIKHSYCIGEHWLLEVTR